MAAVVTSAVVLAAMVISAVVIPTVVLAAVVIPTVVISIAMVIPITVGSITMILLPIVSAVSAVVGTAIPVIIPVGGGRSHANRGKGKNGQAAQHEEALHRLSFRERRRCGVGWFLMVSTTALPGSFSFRAAILERAVLRGQRMHDRAPRTLPTRPRGRPTFHATSSHVPPSFHKVKCRYPRADPRPACHLRSRAITGRKLGVYTFTPRGYTLIEYTLRGYIGDRRCFRK